MHADACSRRRTRSTPPTAASSSREYDEQQAAQRGRRGRRRAGRGRARRARSSSGPGLPVPAHAAHPQRAAPRAPRWWRVVFGVLPRRPRIGDAREDLRVAKEDAFDSIHALWQARAVAYDANGDETRYLLGGPRAAPRSSRPTRTRCRSSPACPQPDERLITARKLPAALPRATSPTSCATSPSPASARPPLKMIRAFARLRRDRRHDPRASSGAASTPTPCSSASGAAPTSRTPPSSASTTALQQVVAINHKEFDATVKRGHGRPRVHGEQVLPVASLADRLPRPLRHPAAPPGVRRVTSPTPLEQIDLLLAAWDERLRRMDENLVALESEAIYQMLAGKAGKRAALEGVTRERVDPALDAVTELFENRERLTAVVAKAKEVRAIDLARSPSGTTTRRSPRSSACSAAARSSSPTASSRSASGTSSTRASRTCSSTRSSSAPRWRRASRPRARRCSRSRARGSRSTRRWPRSSAR